VERTAVASVTSAGPAVQLLWAATITARAKKVKPQLDGIVGSFRCYSDGIRVDRKEEEAF
jgi:hypothetical protein